MSAKSALLRKLNDRNAVIGIVGMGYVGLPLMLRFSEVGYKVLGFDVDAAKVRALNEGNSYIEHIPAAGIQRACKAGFRATAN